VLIIAVARSSYDGSAIHYVLPVLWMAESKTTRMFIRVRQVVAPVKRQTTLQCHVWLRSLCGGTVGEVCLFLLHLMLLAVSTARNLEFDSGRVGVLAQ